jgi:protease I
MSVKNKKIALMIHQQYQELEVWYPYYRFLEEDAKIVRVGAKNGASYPSKLGYPCTADVSAADVHGHEYDAVIIPGGWCPDFMRREDSMVRFIQEAAKAGIVLAAICHGGWMLCCTDALKGKRATSFMAIKFDMINAGATWVDEPVVVDGNLITSRNPDDLPVFCKAVIHALE